MNLILGLGNPGPRYELTRHNIGFLVLDTLTEKHSIKLNQHKYYSLYGKGKINRWPVMAAKPMTYMNESGKAARSILKAMDFSPDGIVVVHDDIDLPLGKVKMKTKGGDAGQLGLRDIIDVLGTDKITRIRFGIGRPESQEGITDYVLSRFTDEELDQLNGIIERAVDLIEQTLEDFHRKSNKMTEENTE